jgi:hypothetical protein
MTQAARPVRSIASGIFFRPGNPPSPILVSPYASF